MIDLFLILIIIILVIVAILLYNQFQKKESLINSLNLRINFLTKQLSEQPEKLQLEEFMSKKKERLMGDEIIEKFMKDKKIEFTKIVDNDDRSEYRLLNSPAENFYCYAWKKNEIVMFRSPIIELIKYDGGELYEGKDVYEKVLHFCDDFPQTLINIHSTLYTVENLDAYSFEITFNILNVLKMTNF